ncbi:MAG TPA: recombinase family protein [Nitrospiraceae bacterium]|nr:recombinase family protein [Nitrospiraceae bacterium]
MRVCRAFAQGRGWVIAQEYSDHAISGATLLRAGFQAMMRDALSRRFDVVLAESLDRFSRDQEDTAGLFERLTYAGVSIVTLAEGDIKPMGRCVLLTRGWASSTSKRSVVS